MYENVQLYHHGIKGQKWGTKNGPPYPLKPSISTGHRLKISIKRGRYGAVPEDPARQSRLAKAKDIVINKAATKMTEMQEKREEKKAEKQAKKIADEQQKKYEDKQSLIKSLDQDEISRRQNELSMAEFEEAIRRCELNRQLMNTKPAEKTFTEKLNENTTKLTSLANTGIGAWNTFAKIYNTFNDEPVPVINGEAFNLQRLDRNKKVEDHKVAEDKRRADSERSKADYEAQNFRRAKQDRERSEWERKTAHEDAMREFREAYSRAQAEEARRASENRARRESESRPIALPGPTREDEERRKRRRRDEYNTRW